MESTAKSTQAGNCNHPKEEEQMHNIVFDVINICVNFSREVIEAAINGIGVSFQCSPIVIANNENEKCGLIVDTKNGSGLIENLLQ